MNHPPSQTVSQYPFENVEGNLFQPVCLKTHWDPTQILRRTLPTQKVGMPLDFRPLVKVCKNYVTSAPPVEAPVPPSNMVFPMGGSFYPPSRYSNAIDQESVLRTLDHPLDRWCNDTQYVVPEDSNMYHAGSTVPDRQPISNMFISELAMPKVLLRSDGDSCRSQNDRDYTERSGRLFNNPTKQDRYGAEKYYALPGGQARGEPMPHGGVPRVRPTAQSMTGRQAMAQSELNRGQKEHTDYTSFVGVATSARAAPVW
jgi:hypothetical protein